MGDPDGHGRFGHLTVARDGRLICHECGRAFLHLATHLSRSHGMTADRYRVAHGLPLSIPLVAESVRTTMAAAWERKRDVHLDTLANHRDPHRARRGMRPASQWTAATRAARMERLIATRGRQLTEAEKDSLGDELPLDEWCRRVRALLASGTGVTVASISRSFDMSASWASMRLRRHPRT